MSISSGFFYIDHIDAHKIMKQGEMIKLKVIKECIKLGCSKNTDITGWFSIRGY